MRDVFISSDHHLGHKNILNFVDEFGEKMRPHANLIEMKEDMIAKHNEVVMRGDLVYFFGDFAFDPDEGIDFMKRTNGRKRLILGNHDQINANSKFVELYKMFDKVVMWRKRGDLRIKMIWSHVPVHPSSLGEFVNVHGHTHARSVDDPRYLNVCVEKTNYAPLSVEEVMKKFES